MKLKKFVLLLVVITVVMNALMPVSFAEKHQSFNDLSKSHWAYSAIMNMTGQGLFSGYPNGSFGPQRTISRAEFVAVVVRVLDVRGSRVPFQDVPRTHWAYSGIGAAVETGIIVPSEYGDLFRPNEPITRLEMAKMLARGLAKVEKEYAEYLNVFKGLYNADLPFVDYREFKQADVPYLALTIGSRMMSGYPDVSFGQDRDANRAEAAVMIASFIKSLNTSPNEMQYLNELKEVAETGMNATTVSNLVPEINLTDEDAAVIEHRMFTAKLKRAYVVPVKSEVVSMYEQKYLWDRTQIPKERIDQVDGWVIGVADVTFHRELGSPHDWGQYLWFSPGLALFYFEPERRFGLISDIMERAMAFEDGKTYEITIYAHYDKEHSRVVFHANNAVEGTEYHSILHNKYR